MPIGFVGPALQGANFIGRFGIPLLQQAGIAAGMAGIGAGIGALTSRPKAKPQNLTGREKINKAWGMLGDAYDTGGFGYRTGNREPYSQPSYADAQGNIYDAVSGRLLYPAKSSTNTGKDSTGPGFSSPGSPAAERAYQAEKSRVAQMTAQDPELQRYEKAREAAKTQEEMNAARDIGMQIWAQKNPGLAAKVKPGQSGYDVIQGTLAGQAAAQGYGYQMPQQITMTPPPGVNVPQGLPAVQSFGASETYGSKGLNLDPEIAKKFEELLNQAKQ